MDVHTIQPQYLTSSHTADFKLSVRDSAEPGLRACVPVSVFSLPLGATTFDYLRRARTLTHLELTVHLHGVRTRYSYDIRPFAVSTLC